MNKHAFDLPAITQRKLCLQFLKSFFVILVLFVVIGSARAATVWSWQLADSTILDSLCTHDTTHSFYDGQSVDILWDRNRTGRDDTLGVWVPGWENRDSLALTCRDAPTCAGSHQGHDTLNYNTFPMNGVAQGYSRGTFYSDYFIRAYGPSATTANLPRPDSFYVRICSDSMYWESGIFSPPANSVSSTHYVDPLPGGWRCVHHAPPPWEAPARSLEGFTASDSTYCDGVHMRWNPYPAYGDSIFIYRSDLTDYIARVPATETSFVYTDVPANVQKQYKARARRNNGKFSSYVFDNGTRGTSPPLVSQVVASDDSTQRIRICWYFPGLEGIDSFAIFRNDVELLKVPRGFTGTQCYTWYTSVSTRFQFCIASWNRFCGYSDYTATCDSGGAITVPTTPQNVQATDGNCNSTTITWDGSAGSPNGYRIWRTLPNGTSPLLIATISEPTHQFVYTAGLCGTVYRYCVAAYNGAGTSPDSLCDTGWKNCAPSAPATVAATDGDFCDHVVISWTPPSGAPAATYYIIKRSGVQIDSVTTSPYSDVGGTPGTVYTYAVIAGNACGRGGSLTDNGSREAPPNPPTALSASDSSNCAGVSLAWTSPGSTDTFYVYRNDTTVYLLRTTSASAFDSSAAAGVIYTYYVRGINTCGSGFLSTSNLGSRKNVPRQVLGVVASDTMAIGVLVTWEPQTADSFLVFRNSELLSTVPSFASSYLDTTVVGCTAYQYAVSAKNSCGNGAVSVPDSGSRSGLLQPTVVDAHDGPACTPVAVSWTYVSGLDGYYLLRNGTILDTLPPTATVFIDSAVTRGVYYRYAVQVFNHCGLGPISAIDSARSRIEVPARVSGVTASDGSCGITSVHWSDDSTETFYQVKRASSNGSNLTTISPVLPANTLSFDDSTGDPFVIYRYFVVAGNLCGTGTLSPYNYGYRSVIPSAPSGVSASDTIYCTHVALQWMDVDFEDGYYIYRDGIVLDSTDADVTQYDDYSALPTVHYAYQVQAQNYACGRSGVSPADSGSRWTLPPVVPFVSATDTNCPAVFLNWGLVPYADSFAVLRDGIRIESLPAGAQAFADTLAVPGVRYGYSVIAVNRCGMGVASVVDSGMRYALPSVLALLAIGETCDHVTVSWMVSSNSDSVRVLRDGETIRVLSASLTEFVDNIRSPGFHTYSVVAKDKCGLSSPYPNVVARIIEFPSRPAGLTYFNNHCNRITLQWAASSGSVQHYRVIRDGQTVGIVPNWETQYVDSNVVLGVSYHYSASAISDTCGEGPPSFGIDATIEETHPPDAPVTVIRAVNKDINLVWRPVKASDGCPVAVTGYLVYYSPGVDSVYYYHGFTEDTTYVHVRAVQFARRMYYQVTAFTGPLLLLRSIPPDMRREDVSRLLGGSR